MFSSRDESHAKNLASLFGHGHVRPVKGKNAFTWIITDFNGVKKYINLINGNLRTPYKYNQICNYGPQKFSLNNLGINLNSTMSLKPINQGWWLCGFTEADGSFVIQVPANRNDIRLLFKFSNSQNYKIILDQLSLCFGGSVYQRLHSNGIISFYWSSPYGIKSVFMVYCYFNNNHLQSSKFIDFLIWRQCFMVVLSNYHIKPLGRLICLYLRDKLKSLRSNSVK